MAVLVLMIGIGVSGLNRLSSVQLRTQTNRLAAAIRHAYNRSVAEGLYVRLVLDLERDKYWVEGSALPVFISRDGSSRSNEDDAPSEDDAENPPRKAGPQYSPLMVEVSMKRGIQINGVVIGGQTDTIETGQAFIHFFPSGYVEPSMIYTSDGKELNYTLAINPMTGRVKRSLGKVEPDQDFGTPDRIEEEGT
jgi:hypothetical protein